MSDLADKLLEELNCKTVFTIHTGFGDIGIAESVVITWVIMAAVFAVSFFLGRDLKVRGGGKRQTVAETIVVSLDKLIGGMTGEEGKAYIPRVLNLRAESLFGRNPPGQPLHRGPRMPHP